MRSIAPALLSVGVLLAGGCSILYDGSAHMTGGGDGCASHQECLESGEGEYCVDGDEGRMCATSCSGDTDCAGHPYGSACLLAACGCQDDGQCEDVSAPRCGSFGACVQCVEDTDCPGALACDENGYCVQCLDDSYCDGGQTCSEGNCI